jgi:hypothetical protein
MALNLTVDELANIANASLENYLDKGKVWSQNIQNKPMLKAFQSRAGKFSGGNEYVSLAVKSGQGGYALAGYSGDDQLAFTNSTGIKRVKWAWKEHHIGQKVTMTELKVDGVDVVENGTDQSTRDMDGREAHALANILDEKNADLKEDFDAGLEDLIHGDGTADAKALAGITSFILEEPDAGSTGGLSRVANTWWKNRALTDANNNTDITVSASAGGALITALDKEIRQLARYAGGSENLMWFAGSDFIDGYKLELRSNGYYSQSMSKDDGQPDGSMKDPRHGGNNIIYDPWMDDNGKSKFCYVIDMGRRGLKLLYMDGQRMKRHNPARPYDRMVMYNGITTTAVMVARSLRSSAVYEID